MLINKTPSPNVPLNIISTADKQIPPICFRYPQNDFPKNLFMEKFKEIIAGCPND